MEGTAKSINATTVRRLAAAVVCLALLYFAAGGSFLHEHKSGPETVCHVCQSLHAPALTAASNTLVSHPQVTGWHVVQPMQLAVLDEFRLYPSGRAPPSL